jgi:hypothetical protein
MLILLALLLAPSGLFAGDFLNTIMHINVGAIYSFPWDGLIDEEYGGYKLYSAYEKKYNRPTNYDASLSFFVDLAPFNPVVLGNEAHALKFGVRGGYRLNRLEQKLTIKPNRKKEEDYGGPLLSYHRWILGPVLRYAPQINALGLGGNYGAVGGLTFFMLFGELVNGELTAFPAKRDREGASSAPVYKTGIKGFAFDLGFGGEISIGALNLGLNFFYSYFEITMGKKIYKNLDKTSCFHEISLELYAGIPIEWW